MDIAPMPEHGRKRVRVLIADDHPLYREGVVRALSASGRVEIVAEAEDGRSALAKIQEHTPDVALLDYKLPELDGVAVTHAVVREQLPVRVLLVSAFTDSGIVYKALGIPVAMFTAIFALARTVGWIAQWKELISDPDQKIGRPRQLFAGSERREFVPMAKRK